MAFDVWLENRTPFAAATHLQMDADGQEVLVTMLSASFDVPQPNGSLRPADEQLPVAFGDVPFGDPARSSSRYEADIAPIKPKAEVIVNGTAHAPNGKPVREMQVGLSVAGIRKVLNVVGDRIFDSGSYSAPHPFRTMPIVYERAYGGTTPDGTVESRNPVGVGFRHAASADPTVRTQAPNITYPGEPFLSASDRPQPAGFGVLARGWQPRLGLAGTYDQSWIDTQWPLPPKDLDPRHYLCAPTDQQLPRLAGGEEVTLIGLTPDGRWSFRLPRVTAPLRLIYDDKVQEQSFVPDTIIIEPEISRVTLKARHSTTTRRNAPNIREIVFGHVTPALLLARRRGKEYRSALGGDGTIPDRPVWRL
ncbi:MULTISPECIES: DUF2169 domain-containing protein [unclassified Mesorhizobium]|uniref:DUF2169 family type VI secretion system accessory protein n=1 Tax=unclassified Mesorhizobium TaxID=325217 RepID=UPI00114DFE10|nr:MULTISPECIES: DUF2169 domain-containing protein [unclassified Mesorhizobium]MBZ9683632.1 DUF2169 domain-containing protein [Mesorhizobium sp. CO1-1-2]MBZ9696512.1 DUF2169 domain-containing protein [Mesorhizobium sp. CO1-1-9]MBZ9725496.1 DUF2169 domain-containing protein [Mesorhizobium sp. CO1-1-11]MBZ9923569.1 DUF2169 domain-containing protein [Mesorhizobium sp. BR1-1-4]TPK80148.1 DUF2169 domain-containing protein [Mesorhizobium sp. B2-4-13]